MMTRRFLLLLVPMLLAFAPAQAQPVNTRFVAIAFHDVVDRREELTPDAVTTDQLVRFFEWLKGNGWTVLSLDDVAAAARGRALPEHAILLTFDDGYRSLYTRVFPLLQAYRFPAVAALVGRWMEGGGADGMVDYGGRRVPRTNFVSWAEAREMQASGLVEIASHSFDLHKGEIANPQGNEIPAARGLRYDADKGAYETDAQYRARIRHDFAQARSQMARELGHAPRALVWPFGRYTGPAREEAAAAGFRFAITLDAASADAMRPMDIPRYFPTFNPSFGEIATNLRFDVERPETVRIACLGLDGLASAAGAEQDRQLGRMIEDLRTLGANKVVLAGNAALAAIGAPIDGVYFPSRLQPMRADLLSRAAWQIRSRAGAEVYLYLPGQPSPELVAEMVQHVPSDGLVLEASSSLGTRAAIERGTTRARRMSLDPATLDPANRRVLETWRAAARIDPQLRLILALRQPGGPPDWADYVLLPAAASAAGTVRQAESLRADGWYRPDLAGRVVLTLPPMPGEQVAALRGAQRLGGAGFAVCPQAPLPPTPALAAAFSAATYPHRP
jgi:peptidoglycan/xylan/chitin deacetylase (PgdA/CDA1 family)